MKEEGSSPSVRPAPFGKWLRARGVEAPAPGPGPAAAVVAPAAVAVPAAPLVVVVLVGTAAVAEEAVFSEEACCFCAAATASA